HWLRTSTIYHLSHEKVMRNRHPQHTRPAWNGLAKSRLRGSTRTAKPCCPLARHGIVPAKVQLLPSCTPLWLMLTVRGLGISPNESTRPWKSCTSTSSGVKLPRLTRAFTCSSAPTCIGSAFLASTASILICDQPWLRRRRHWASCCALPRLSAVRSFDRR